MPTQDIIHTRMQALAAQIGYEYQNIAHLAKALYCEKENARNDYTNDAMATLGDAVLKLVWSEHFYDMGLDKDEITARKVELEKNATLKSICDKIGIYRFAYNDSYFADEAPPSKRLPYGNHDIYLEATIAAIYKDRGLDYVRQWILRFWKAHTDLL